MMGSIEIIGLLGAKLDLKDSVWRWAATLDLNVVGFVIVAIFVPTWAVAILIWRSIRGTLDKPFASQSRSRLR